MTWPRRLFPMALLWTLAAGVFSMHAEELTEAEQAAVEPIPMIKGALVVGDVQRMYRQWAQVNVIEAFQRDGHHDVAWDEAAAALLARIVDAWAKSLPEAERAKLQPAANVVASSGCDDALVLLAASEFVFKDASRRPLLDRAIASFPASKYSKFFPFIARARQSQKEDGTQGGPEEIAAALAALDQALPEHPLSPEDHQVWSMVLHRYLEAFSRKNGAAVCAAFEGAKTVDDWLKLRLRGSCEVELAWQTRGPGWASEVTNPGWKGFEEHAAAAELALTKSWELNPRHPLAAHEMLRISWGSPREMRKWFDRAVTARFDFGDAYDRCLWGLRPRWGGSYRAMLLFGEQCLATQRFDTSVPEWLYRAVAEIAEDTKQPEVYFRTAAPFAALQTMFEGYINEPTQAANLAYYRSRFAIVAERCGQLEECLKQLRLVRFQIDPRAASETGVDRSTWPRRAAAYAGSAGDKLRLADAEIPQRDWAKAVELLTAARDLPDLDEPAKKFIAERLRHAEAQAADRGPWSPVVKDQSLSGWTLLNGEVKLSGANVVELRPSGTKTTYAMLPNSLIGEFEVRGVLSWDPAGMGETVGRILIQESDAVGKGALTLRFGHKENGEETLALIDHGGFERLNREIKYRDNRASFYLRVAEGRLAIWIDDQFTLEEALGLRNNARHPIGFNFAADAKGGPATIRFENVEAREAP